MAKPKIAEAQALDGMPGKRRAIVVAAMETFLESGYAAASMDAVAARAGVSKATIYAHFAGKTALFEAVIRCRCEQEFGTLEMPAADHESPRDVLTRIARQVLGLLTSPEALAMFRVVVAEAPRLPEVGDSFYAAGPTEVLAGIAGYFAEATRKGLLDVPDPQLAADMFVGMLKGDYYLRCLLGLPKPPYGAEAVVEQAVAATLAAFARK
jgi:TetR/AcrR family transcriptional repressor of mexJK operon